MQARTEDTVGQRDEREIAFFNKQAKTWWDPNGPMKPLHRMNTVRMRYLRDVFTGHFQRDAESLTPFSGLSLLDIGCGGGLVTEPSSRTGFSVMGIDLAEKNIAVARAHAESSGLSIDYQAVSLESLPESENFDAITLLEVVEHVPDPAALIKEAAKRLKPGGILITSTINRTMKAYALAIIGAEYVLRWLPKGTHAWEKFVTPEEMQNAFRDANLTPTEVQGVFFNPLRMEWQLSHDSDVNYLAIALKL